MAWFIDGWVWEPVDMQILRGAMDGTKIPSSRIYRDQAEERRKRGFIQIDSDDGFRMTASLTLKGRETAKKVLGNA